MCGGVMPRRQSSLECLFYESAPLPLRSGSYLAISLHGFRVCNEIGNEADKQIDDTQAGPA